MEQKPVRLGLIGAGPWGRNYIRTIKELKDAHLAYLVSRNPKSRLLVDSRSAILSDWRELLGKNDLDGVITAVPATMHAEIAVAVLSAGLPLMLEKPLALNLDNALCIKEAVEKSRLPVVVDHTYLFHPAFLALKEKARDFGKISFVKTAGHNEGPFRKGVSPLWDWGPHDVAMCLDLFGAFPEKIEASETKKKDLPEGKGQMVNIRLEFPGGVLADITVGNMQAPKARRFTAGFGDSILVFDDLAKDKLVLRDKTGEVPLEISVKPPLTEAVETFVRAIRGECPPRLGVSLGVDVVRVLSLAESLL